MTNEVEEVLYHWAFLQFPYLLEDPELFHGLVALIRRIVCDARATPEPSQN